MKEKIDIVKTLQNDKTKIVDLVAQKIQFSTVAIYYHKLDSLLSIKPEQIATGVLLKTESNHYLITAAHTFNHYRKEDICLYKSQSKIPLVGRLYLFDPIDSQVNDLIDIAVIKLEEFIVDRIYKTDGIEFLSSKFIKQRHSTIPSKSYFTLGFPCKKQIKKKQSKKFSSQPYLIYSHPSISKSYNQPLVNRDLNILIDYHRRKFKQFDEKGRSFAPQYLEGMSGSGLWFIPSFDTNVTKETNVFLIGILIELKGKNNSIMFTKIDCVTEILRKCCNEDFEQFIELKTKVVNGN